MGKINNGEKTDIAYANYKQENVWRGEGEGGEKEYYWEVDEGTRERGQYGERNQETKAERGKNMKYDQRVR